MTLVVAYCTDDICFMVGDTLVTHQHFELKGDLGPINGEYHSLKIQILNGALAVAFAGDFDAAYSAVQALKSHLYTNPNIDPVIWLSQQEGLSGCEFLVLVNQKEKRLFLVRNDELFECRRAYIGSADDYKRYTVLRKEYAGPDERQVVAADGKQLRLPVTDGEKEFDIVSDAMEALSRDLVGKKYQLVGAVSGFVTRVADARTSKELEYLQSVEISSQPWEPAGGYSVLADNTDTRGLGIYFRAGGRGFVFPVCGTPPCVPSGADSLSAFIQEAHDRWGMKLVGGTWP
ncbi:hypothetical protein [Bradyrhizobium sp. ORS 86]|uniref:hypothetical protein n=1 Tax=Bradyrhizobium sp. ORS 86 TaxID=1685970 RepID=UPI00388DF578